MEESSHDNQSDVRGRSGRLPLSYPIELEDGQGLRSLPLVVGVIGDFCGDSNEVTPLRLGRFISIDYESFDDIMQRVRPRLALRVDNKLGPTGQLAIELQFRTLNDFSPNCFVEQVEPLRRLRDDCGSGNEPADENSARLVQQQLAAIMHAPAFQRLEASWRGLHYLVSNTETSANLRVRMLSATKAELLADVGGDQPLNGWLAKSLFSEWNTPGGDPFGVVVTDYEFSNREDDARLLSGLATIGARASCPFLAAAECGMFRVPQAAELSRLTDLKEVFASSDYAQWNALRERAESHFVVLTIPRMLARAPYGPAKSNPEYSFQEARLGADSQPLPLSTAECVWMNSAYALAGRMTVAFSRTNWCWDICGPVGGKVENPPVGLFEAAGGDGFETRLTEAAFDEKQEAELLELGFTVLSQRKNADEAVFFNPCAIYKPNTPTSSEASFHSATSARLHYMLVAARVAHHATCIARDLVGCFMLASDVECWLNRWIADYVVADSTSQHDRLGNPSVLTECSFALKESAERPGEYVGEALMCVQLPEASDARLRIEFEIPTLA